MMANEHITVGNNSYEKVKTFKYLGYLLKNQNFIHEEMKCKLKIALQDNIIFTKQNYHNCVYRVFQRLFKSFSEWIPNSKSRSVHTCSLLLTSFVTCTISRPQSFGSLSMGPFKN